jgi:hypothetical protein
VNWLGDYSVFEEYRSAALMSSSLSCGHSLSVCFVVMPLARSSMIRCTGTRVPFMTGFPTRIARMRVPKFHALYTWFFDCSFDASAELFVCAQPTPPVYCMLQI